MVVLNGHGTGGRKTAYGLGSFRVENAAAICACDLRSQTCTAPDLVCRRLPMSFELRYAYIL